MTAVAAPARVRVRVKWTTPRRLHAYRVAIWAFAALLFLVGEATLDRAREAMKTIGKDAAPSILAAQEIASALADLDANAANYLIGTTQHRVEAMAAFERRRTQVTGRLVDAAQNITYGDAEKEPILTMIQELGRYLELFARASLRYDGGDVPGAIETYQAATSLMHARILVAAQALDTANRDYMDSAYERQLRASWGAEAVAGTIGGALVLLLALLQIFLARRTRRIFNPALVVATILAVFFTAHLIESFQAARADLAVAKQDAFESIHLMWRARAVAFDANGDESRYLMDRAGAPAAERAFFDHVQQLTSAPADKRWTARGAQANGVRGYFADEMRNITFEGEREAAQAMIDAFAQYYMIDARIRELERRGQHDAAVKLCLGTGASESNAAFERFDRALMDVVDINMRQFERVVDVGSAALRRAEVLDPIVACAIALLVWLGLRPRLREYAA